MAEFTKIEWADHTFNPWIGCSKVHAGCTNCYAEADMDRRRKRAKWGIDGTRTLTSTENWKLPRRWDKHARKFGYRPRVFCASLADVFEDWKGPVLDHNGNRVQFYEPNRGVGRPKAGEHRFPPSPRV